MFEMSIEGIDEHFYEASEKLYGEEWVSKAKKLVSRLRECGINAYGMTLNLFFEVFDGVDDGKLTEEMIRGHFTDEQYEDLLSLHEAMKEKRQEIYDKLYKTFPTDKIAAWDPERKVQTKNPKFESLYGNYSDDFIAAHNLICSILDINYEVRFATDVSEVLLSDSVEIAYIPDEMKGSANKGHYLFECENALKKAMEDKLIALGYDSKKVLKYGHEKEQFPDLKEPLLTEEEAIEIIKKIKDKAEIVYSVNVRERKVIMNEAKRQQCIKSGFNMDLLEVDVHIPKERFLEEPDETGSAGTEMLLIYKY